MGRGAGGPRRAGALQDLLLDPPQGRRRQAGGGVRAGHLRRGGRGVGHRGPRRRCHRTRAGRREAARGGGPLPLACREHTGRYLHPATGRAKPNDVREPADRGHAGLHPRGDACRPGALDKDTPPGGPREGARGGRADQPDRRALRRRVPAVRQRRPGGVGARRGRARARRGRDPPLLAGRPARHNRAQAGRGGRQGEREEVQAALRPVGRRPDNPRRLGQHRGLQRRGVPGARLREGRAPRAADKGHLRQPDYTGGEAPGRGSDALGAGALR